MFIAYLYVVIAKRFDNTITIGVKNMKKKLIAQTKKNNIFKVSNWDF